MDTVTFRVLMNSFHNIKDIIYCGNKKVLIDDNTRFELCGIVVARGTRGEKQGFYRLDDGTGAVECIKWFRGDTEAYLWEPPKFGQLVIATGTIDPMSPTSKRQLSIHKERFPTDPNEEILFWAEALKLGKDYYKIL